MSSTPDNLHEELPPAGADATSSGLVLDASEVVLSAPAEVVESNAENSGVPTSSEPAEMAVVEPPPLPEVQPETQSGPTPLENPVWGGLDLLLLGAVLLGGMFVALMVTAIVRTAWNMVHHLPGDAGITKPDAFTAIPVEMIAYAVFLLVVWLLIRRRNVLSFLAAIRWNFPAGRWWVFLGSGVLLAATVGLLSRILPIPKTVPLDDFFSSPAAAWLMAFFGVLIAPPIEELLFRGLLYPVLVRSLGRMFAERLRLRNAALGLFVLGCWGIVGHIVTGAVNTALVLLLPFFLALPVAAFRIGKPGVNALRVALGAAAMLAWGALMHAAPYSLFAVTSMLLFAATVGLAALSMQTELSWRTASRAGLTMAVVLTAAAFALLHAEQLGGAWGPLALIFFVGLTLTTVRAMTKSVAASTLLHMGYNGTLFSMMYLGTGGFQHLERLSR